MSEGRSLFSRIFNKRVPVPTSVEQPLEPDIGHYTKQFVEGSQKLRRELGRRFDAFWKIDPKDIADLYLIAPIVQNSTFVHSTENISETKEDEQIMEFRLKEIGEKLAFGMLVAQVDEFAQWDILKKAQHLRFSHLEPQVAQRIHARAKTIQDPEEMPKGFEDLNDPARVNIGILLRKLQEASSKKDVSLVFEDRDFLFDALRIFEENQGAGRGNWSEMATILRTYLFPYRSANRTNNLPIFSSENARNVYLLDRLVNVVHNTGNLYQTMSNDFTRVGFLLYLQEEKSNVSTFLQSANSEIRKIATKNRGIFGEYFTRQIEPKEFIARFEGRIKALDKAGLTIERNSLECIMLGFDDNNLTRELLQFWTSEGKDPRYEVGDSIWTYWNSILSPNAKPAMMRMLRRHDKQKIPT